MAVTIPTSGAPLAASEEVLQPFLATSFDPADYLNSALPSWSSSGQPREGTASLAELNTQTQTLVSQLNAQLTRLSNTLTQQTDDILRTGGRLAYEVEMLRGDATGLADVLVDGLHDEILKFVPQGISLDAEKAANGADDAPKELPTAQSQPDYVERLKQLAIVKDKLDTVIRVFGDAMDWHLPPSEAASSVIGMPSAADNAELERRGKEYMQKQKAEIADLVDADDDAYEVALQRVEALRKLSVVWKGTAEERPRTKFVDELESIIDAAGTQGNQARSIRGYQLP